MYNVKSARKRQEVLCFIVLIFLPCSYSSGKLSIQLLDYRNAASRTYDGGCCDNIRYCVSSCDNFFILCLAGEGVTNKCSLYRRVTQVTSSDSFSFSTSLGNGLRNPVIYGFTAWQPLKFSVEVWDDDSSNFVGKDSDLIDRYTLNIQHLPSPNKRDAPEHRHSLSGRQSTMKTKVKVYCDDFYFAPNCSTYCKSRDDSTGHYTCNYTLGRKVCREGWYGKDCLVYCRPRNDSSGHYMCNEMGQKLCLDGWIGGNCTQENSSKIHPSSASSASIGSFHFSSTSNGTILSSPSFTSQHKHFFTVPILQASSTDNGPILPVSSSDNGPILPASSSDNGPILQASSTDNGPILPVSSFDNGPILPVSSSDNGPILSASSSDNGPILQASSSYNGPILPVSSSDSGPILPVSSSDNGPILPVSSSDSGPILPVSSSYNGPILPVSSSDSGPILPVSSSFNSPILPVSSSDSGPILRTSSFDNGPILRTSSFDNGPILRTSSSDNGPILRTSSSDNGPILRTSSPDSGPILPLSSLDNGPILTASSIPSSYNGHDWPSTSVDRNTMLSPTATVLSFLSVNSSHSTRTNHTRVASSAHSTKITPLLGSTFTYSHLQVKVSSTMTNKIKVSAPTDNALSSASKESDCGPASIANSELALTPVFMEIEMSKPVNRENVIAQVKPLILLKINEYCKMERQSCNIPTCWINSTRVLFQIKQLILEIMNKEVEYQSKMTLQLMVRLPGGNEGIVPSDILLEILNTAISDIEQSCDVHVVRIWIENTTDSSISGLLKNESPSTSDGSRALTFIAVGAGSVVVMIVVLGILYHRLRNIRSKRLKVNPLTDDDCTPPDSPDIDIADKTRLLRKQDLENLKTSSQLNEELELTSRIPGTVT